MVDKKKDIKLVHFTIMDGNEEQIRALGKAINNIKERLPFDIEFLITNDKIELHSVKYMIDELYKIYQLMNKDKHGVKK